jgi:hypothetical protein
MATVNIGCGDMNIKTGTGPGHGVIEWTDRDGDKIYWAWTGQGGKDAWFGPATLERGTGKFERLKGKATWTYYDVAPNQSYADWNVELELPR